MVLKEWQSFCTRPLVKSGVAVYTDQNGLDSLLIAYSEGMYRLKTDENGNYCLVDLGSELMRQDDAASCEVFAAAVGEGMMCIALGEVGGDDHNTGWSRVLIYGANLGAGASLEEVLTDVQSVDIPTATYAMTVGLTPFSLCTGDGSGMGKESNDASKIGTEPDAGADAGAGSAGKGGGGGSDTVGRVGADAQFEAGASAADVGRGAEADTGGAADEVAKGEWEDDDCSQDDGDGDGEKGKGEGQGGKVCVFVSGADNKVHQIVRDSTGSFTVLARHGAQGIQLHNELYGNTVSRERDVFVKEDGLGDPSLDIGDAVATGTADSAVDTISVMNESTYGEGKLIAASKDKGDNAPGAADGEASTADAGAGTGAGGDGATTSGGDNGSHSHNAPPVLCMSSCSQYTAFGHADGRVQMGQVSFQLNEPVTSVSHILIQRDLDTEGGEVSEVENGADEREGEWKTGKKGDVYGKGQVECVLASGCLGAIGLLRVVRDSAAASDWAGTSANADASSSASASSSHLPELDVGDTVMCMRSSASVMGKEKKVIIAIGTFLGKLLLYESTLHGASIPVPAVVEAPTDTESQVLGFRLLHANLKDDLVQGNADTPGDVQAARSGSDFGILEADDDAEPGASTDKSSAAAKEGSAAAGSGEHELLFSASSQPPLSLVWSRELPYPLFDVRWVDLMHNGLYDLVAITAHSVHVLTHDKGFTAKGLLALLEDF
ncbi:unnamed protein product [Chrysoparadoxa australica]